MGLQMLFTIHHFGTKSTINMYECLHDDVNSRM